jgi:CBS domain-containing protein
MDDRPAPPLKTVGDIMVRDVVTVAAGEPISKVTEVMTHRKIGCVVVMKKGDVAGIITERDLLTRVLDGKKNPINTTAGDVMTTPTITVGSKTSIYYASRLMEKNDLRRLPVVDGGKLIGIVTQRDLSKAMTTAMVDLVPQVEPDLKSTPIVIALEGGRSYLIEEKKPTKSCEIFVDMVKHGHKGMCICRINPNKIRETYDLATTPLIWITDIKTDEPHLDSTDLAGISNVVSEFVKKAEDGVVFIEAFTYLITRNDFANVLHMIQHIRDVISEGKSSLILHVDPVVLTERELELLTQEIDDVRFRAY